MKQILILTPLFKEIWVDYNYSGKTGIKGFIETNVSFFEKNGKYYIFNLNTRNFKIFVINSKILYYSSDVLSEDNFISDKYWGIDDSWQRYSSLTEKEVWKHIKLLSFK